MENRNWNSDKLGSVIEIKYGKVDMQIKITV